MQIKIKITKQQVKALRDRLSVSKQNGNFSETQRIVGLMMLAAGVSINDICDQLGVGDRTIRNWIQRFMLGGINGVFDKKRSGRPPKMTKTQRRALARIIERGPEKYGFLSACWRTPLIQEVVQAEFGISYSARYISELLKSMGFSYQRAQVVSASRDPEERQRWQDKTLPGLIKKAKRKGGYLFFGDECSFPQWATISYTWAKVGVTPTIKTSGSRKSYKVFGVIDYFSGRFISKGTTERLNSDSYIDFLKEILRRTVKHVFLIQDGAQYHKSKKVKNFISENKSRLTVETLPAYSPDYNPIEKLWKKIKQEGTHLKYFPKFDDLINTVEETLDNFHRMRGEIITLFG